MTMMPKERRCVGATVLEVYHSKTVIGSSPQELTLHEGDIVTVIGKEDDVWWCGQVGERIGMFPAAYVEPYSF